MTTYVSRPQLIETAARDCEIRGGEYVAKDPASYAAALDDWQKKAEGGDIKAMLYVGEIYEKGPAGIADPAKAAGWYRRAADLGSAEAQGNLASLYERGAGVPMDKTAAKLWHLRRRGEDQLAAALPGTPTAESADVTRLRAELQTAEEERIRLRTQIVQLQQDIDSAQSGSSGSQHMLEQERRSYQEQIDKLQRDLRDKNTQISQIQDRTKTRSESSAATPSNLFTGLSFGKYYALVIGNSNYRAPLKYLENAERDARAIANLLESRYGMQVTRVIDGTRESIYGAVLAIIDMAGPDDNVLIYYAGHGKLEEIPEKKYIEGYWLPVDSSLSNTASWINTDEITKFMKRANARHVLVIADSCYAGSQFRSAPDMIKRRELVERLNQKQARVLLTSGGRELVLDTGGNGHSVFAQALLDNLASNQQPILSSELFQMILPSVISEARGQRHEQTPQHGPIPTAGDQGGEFFFVPRGAITADRDPDPRMFAALRLHALDYDADRAITTATH